MVLRDRGNFKKKISHEAKITKNGQKIPKNSVFGLLRKISSLVLSENNLKWKLVWSINILRKQHSWEKIGSHVMTKNAASQ